MTISARIKLRMSELSLTQEAVAHRAGISQGMVYKLLSGKTTSTSKLVELADALECGVEWLATGKTELREDVETYKADVRLSSEQIKAQLAKLPANVQKEIALEIMESLMEKKRR